MTKIWPWNRPLSIYEGKALLASSSINKFDGQCSVCKDKVKFITVFNKDKMCCECMYKLANPKRKRRNFDE